ncbi:MAG: Flp pilus assembly protein CpaB [Pirellulales bacterium]
MKRISPATVTVGVFAILFGLVAAYATKRYFAAPEPVPPPTESFVVARINLPQYARIREQDVEVIQVPLGRAPEGALRMRNNAVFRLTRDSIRAGEPIFEADLYEIGKSPTLADQIPPGLRAVTVSVDREAAVDGLILPDSHVDVSLTVHGDHPELNGVATLTLMRNVLVLATNQNRYPGEERMYRSLRTVTLAVTPEQSNRLILAERYGSLSVSLRSSVDDALAAGDVDDNLVNPSDLLNLSPIEPVAQVQKTVHIWRGTQMQELTFLEDRIQESYDTTAAIERRQSGVPAVVPTGFGNEKQHQDDFLYDGDAAYDADVPTHDWPFGESRSTSQLNVVRPNG